MSNLINDTAKIPTSRPAGALIVTGYLVLAFAMFTILKLSLIGSTSLFAAAFCLLYLPKPRYSNKFPTPKLVRWIPLILMIPILSIGFFINSNPNNWPVSPLGLAFTPQVFVYLYYDIKNRRTPQSVA